jgi:hypothetical protein
MLTVDVFSQAFPVGSVIATVTTPGAVKFDNPSSFAKQDIFVKVDCSQNLYSVRFSIYRITSLSTNISNPSKRHERYNQHLDHFYISKVKPAVYTVYSYKIRDCHFRSNFSNCQLEEVQNNAANNN